MSHRQFYNYVLCSPFCSLRSISPGRWATYLRAPHWQSTQTPTSTSSPSPSHQTATAALPAPPAGEEEAAARVKSRAKVWWRSPTRVPCAWKREVKAARQSTASAATAARMRAATGTTAARDEAGFPTTTTRPAQRPSSPPWSSCGPLRPSPRSRTGPAWREWDWTPGSHEETERRWTDRWRMEMCTCGLCTCPHQPWCPRSRSPHTHTHIYPPSTHRKRWHHTHIQTQHKHANTRTDTHLYGNVHTHSLTHTQNPEGLSHQTRDYLSKQLQCWTLFSSIWIDVNEYVCNKATVASKTLNLATWLAEQTDMDSQHGLHWLSVQSPTLKSWLSVYPLHLVSAVKWAHDFVHIGPTTVASLSL